MSSSSIDTGSDHGVLSLDAMVNRMAQESKAIAFSASGKKEGGEAPVVLELLATSGNSRVYKGERNQGSCVDCAASVT
jgi:hypothetical protein